MIRAAPKKVFLNNQINVIPKSTFKFCTNLTYVDFQHVELIDEFAFFGCISFSELFIKNVKIINSYAFSKCHFLLKILKYYAMHLLI